MGKTGLVALFDSTLNTVRGLVMVSRSRRFGKSFAALFSVVHTKRGDTIRIISARLATSEERRTYGRQGGN